MDERSPNRKMSGKMLVLLLWGFSLGLAASISPLLVMILCWESH